jgi:hypothetical protein
MAVYMLRKSWEQVVYFKMMVNYRAAKMIVPLGMMHGNGVQRFNNDYCG